ncbi:MAG: polysaccharide pyruvyl transferase family protein [Candidatus Pacebacteria bacterium]|nr:polysaccharide pyruvyl transferase family protein [Candidatus Paceibacterota bacterium]
MNNPLVSVIVPTKNSSKTLEACLESIKNQSYKNIEIIVVDNNSSDNTKVIAGRYTERVFNKGPERSAQVNFGVEKSNGEYVYKVDSDFVLDSEVIDQCVNEINKGFDAIVVHNSPDVRISWIAKVRKFEVDMYKYDIIHSSARFIKKDIYGKIGGFNEKIIAGEDYDFQNKLNRGGYKTGFIEAEALHLGEPTDFWKHMMKYHEYGKDFVNYRVNNEEESGKQLSFFRNVYFKNWKKFLLNPFMAIIFIIYNCFKFGFGGIGYLTSFMKKGGEIKVLLIGTHGQNNIGDELLLETFLFQLRKIDNISFFVNSYQPQKTREDFKVKTFHTLNEKHKLLFYIFDCDLLFFAGGSIVKELYSDYGRDRYSVLNILILLIIFTKRIGRKKIILSNVGIGPLNTEKGFKKSSYILESVDFVSVRDSSSLSFGEQVNKKIQIEVVPDAVFSLDRVYFDLSGRNIDLFSGVNVIGLNLCRNIAKPEVWDYFILEMMKVVIGLYKKNNMIRIVGIPMQFDYSCDDYETLSLFRDKIKNEIPDINFEILVLRSAVDVARVINVVDLVIAERLHCSILSTIIHTPFIALEYDIKVKSYLSEINLEKSGFDISFDFNSENVLKRIEDISSNYSKERDYLKNISAKKKNKVDSYFAKIRKMIKDFK